MALGWRLAERGGGGVGKGGLVATGCLERRLIVSVSGLEVDCAHQLSRECRSAFPGSQWSTGHHLTRHRECCYDSPFISMAVHG